MGAKLGDPATTTFKCCFIFLFPAWAVANIVAMFESREIFSAETFFFFFRYSLPHGQYFGCVSIEVSTLAWRTLGIIMTCTGCSLLARPDELLQGDCAFRYSFLLIYIPIDRTREYFPVELKTHLLSRHLVAFKKLEQSRLLLYAACVNSFWRFNS